ncbi:unnamed protein product [Caenorhabditis bovis]|uniref:Uncharacterized protein n=1 Tax=Caenorhabditis bovis TaxID=2654633 RepID=A0A8S1EP64_9PELO|nr:unnamed protein product [Caenorhabditis bovis]
MNQNLSYTYTSDPRNGANGQNQQIQGLSFHPTSYQTSTYTNSTTAPFHSSSSAAFIPNNVTQNQPRRIGEDKNLVNMLDAYFIDSTTPSTSSSWNNQQPVQMQQLSQSVTQYSQSLVPQIKEEKFQTLEGVTVKMSNSPDKTEKERQKKARQAEAARMRYHRLSNEEKRELNLKRTLAQKRKRQREKEMEELESILRETNDIQEDPDITEQLREKRMRAKWAEAARARYARMTPEERRAHNTRRRMRQMQNAMSAIKASGVATGDPQKDDEAVRAHIKAMNAKKAEAARQRYHRMSDEEKRIYNQRRTEAFRRRRMEEEMLLAMPIGRINGEALDRAQQIVVRNAKRAEAARLRYQRMTPDQRKLYNQKRYTPKRRRNELEDMMNAGQMAVGSSGTIGIGTGTVNKKEDLDALSTLERDVIKRTQQAQQILLRQQRANQDGHESTTSPQPQTYIIQPASNGQPQQQAPPSQQQQQQQQQAPPQAQQQQPGQQQQQHLATIQIGANNGTNGLGHQVVHGVHQLQPAQVQLQVSHQQSSGTIPQQLYTSNMMISGGLQQTQDMNHNEYVTEEQKMTASEANSTYQTSSYYSPSPSSYQTVSSMSFPSNGDEVERKNDYILIAQDNVAASTSAGLMKEHPAAVQADQMNAFIDSYFVEHPSSSADVSDDIGHEDEEEEELEDDELDESLMDELNCPKNPVEEIEAMQKQAEVELLNDPSMSEKVREERSRQRRAAAARSRYQRMTESERRLYNHRRRLKQLGLDPESAKTDMELVRQHVKMANAKKAEAARMRYHRMTPEQKRDYNMRRTEAFRRRRQEEEMLLSTPAGRISAEALAKAQQIMVRNARKAESARLRYQRMTPEERRQYNLKRAAAKKKRKEQMMQQQLQQQQQQQQQQHQQQQSANNRRTRQQPQIQMIHPPSSTSSSRPPTTAPSSDGFDAAQDLQDHQLSMQMEEITMNPIECVMVQDRAETTAILPTTASTSGVATTAASKNVEDEEAKVPVSESKPFIVTELISEDPSTSEQHMLDVINQVATPTQLEIFAQMERDVIRRTKQAHMILQRQQISMNVDNMLVGDIVGHAITSNSSNAIVGGIQYDIPHSEQELIVEQSVSSPHTQILVTEHDLLSGGGSTVANDDDVVQPGEKLIDEKALHEMLRTGLDSNGQPVEIRMADGTPISGAEQLSCLGGGQTILITQHPPIESKVSTHLNGDYHIGTSQSSDMTLMSSAVNSYTNPQIPMDGHGLEQAGYGMGGINSELHQPTATEQKLALNRAKRAERARLRYHRMSAEERREQNARRADMLRKSRQRDEELVQLAETVPADQIDEETKQLIREAQARRLRRAEQARAKYHRMDSEQRRQYNAMRDAQRRQRKREQDRIKQEQQQQAEQEQALQDGTVGIGEVPESNSISMSPSQQNDVGHDDVMYSSYQIFENGSWEN